MKKIILYILPAIMLLSACNDFLDENMKGNFNTKSMFSSAAEAKLAVNGVYNASTYLINLWKIGDVASDDALKGGNEGDMSELSYIDNFTANADNGVLSEYWQNTYEIISRANNVIGYMPGVPGMTDEMKANYVAQAKFFRALAYFTLVNIYGEVPLKLEPQGTSASINVPLSTVDAIYAQIEKDLTDAAPALDVTPSEAGRVSRGAALGLLAKTYLYENKYTETLAAIAQLEKLSVYSLEKDYSTLFKLGNEDSKEVIFAIRFLSGQNPGLGNILNQYFAPQQELGYYFDAPTQSYVDCFNEKTTDGKTDPRLDASIGRDGMPWLNGDTFHASWSPATGYLVKKHNQPLSEVPAGKKGDGGLAYIYLRYADILLMKAEAENEITNTGDALTALNQVRERAGLGKSTAIGQISIREAIRTERRRELGFEFHRFFDLMRWGKATAVAALGSSLPWKDSRFYFPIPQTERDANLALK